MLADKLYWTCATTGLVLALAMTFHPGTSHAGKPEALQDVVLTFDGSSVGGSAPSFDVKRSSKRGVVLVEIVVRGMDLSVPAAFSDPDIVRPGSWFGRS